MLIKANDKTWIVNFSYGETKRKCSEDTYWKLRTTTIRVRPHGCEKGVDEQEHTVTCDSRDKFVKAMGRKKAIHAFMKQNAEFEDKSKRAEFWKNYIAQTNV